MGGLTGASRVQGLFRESGGQVGIAGGIGILGGGQIQYVGRIGGCRQCSKGVDGVQKGSG